MSGKCAVLPQLCPDCVNKAVQLRPENAQLVWILDSWKKHR